MLAIFLTRITRSEMLADAAIGQGDAFVHSEVQRQLDSVCLVKKEECSQN